MRQRGIKRSHYLSSEVKLSHLHSPLTESYLKSLGCTSVNFPISFTKFGGNNIMSLYTSLITWDGKKFTAAQNIPLIRERWSIKRFLAWLEEVAMLCILFVTPKHLFCGVCWRWLIAPEGILKLALRDVHWRMNSIFFAGTLLLCRDVKEMVCGWH